MHNVSALAEHSARTPAGPVGPGTRIRTNAYTPIVRTPDHPSPHTGHSSPELYGIPVPPMENKRWLCKKHLDCLFTNPFPSLSVHHIHSRCRTFNCRSSHAGSHVGSDTACLLPMLLRLTLYGSGLLLVPSADSLPCRQSSTIASILSTVGFPLLLRPL